MATIEGVLTSVSSQKVVGSHKTTFNDLFYAYENGLLLKQFKAFLDFRLSTKLVKIVKQMTYADLKDFDFSKKYMVNGTRYLVKSVQVPLKRDRILPALLECYPCP